MQNKVRDYNIYSLMTLAMCAQSTTSTAFFLTSKLLALCLIEPFPVLSSATF
jgi:hypothetical protein